MATIGQFTIEAKNKQTAEFFEQIQQREKKEQIQAAQEQKRLRRIGYLVRSGLWFPEDTT